jgi:hypothetical protein
MENTSDEILFGSVKEGKSSFRNETHGKEGTKDDPIHSKVIQMESENPQPLSIETNFMYIQMEFCEKSTLR